MKNYGIILLGLFFIAFPFCYFYFALTFNNSFFANVQTTYLVIMLSGLPVAYLIEKNIKHAIQTETKQLFFLIAATGVSIYAAFLFLMTWSRYANFISEVIDVNYFHQVIWQLAEFKIPYIWGLNQPVYPAWSQHFSPILIFLAPVYWFVQDAGTLMVMQALAVISGAYPIYVIAKKFLKSRSIGVALSFAYLAFGGLQFGIAYGFHEIMFFPPLFFWAYYLYLRDKKKSYWLLILLCLFVKEEAAFIIGAWSLYLLAIKRDKFFGFTTAVMAVLWYFLCFTIIFPAFNHGQDFGYWGQYTQQGGSGITGIATSMLFHPLQFLNTLITPALKIDTFLQTFGSFAFLLFLYPPSVIIVIPSLLEKLLSSGIAMANGQSLRPLKHFLIFIKTHS